MAVTMVIKKDDRAAVVYVGLRMIE
ncbi:hypothetical protein Tco_0837951, partial [Tanacetum coccineum]